jgi:hypothetical protein
MQVVTDPVSLLVIVRRIFPSSLALCNIPSIFHTMDPNDSLHPSSGPHSGMFHPTCHQEKTALC